MSYHHHQLLIIIIIITFLTYSLHAAPSILSPPKGQLYSIPHEGQPVVFNCSTSSQHRALFWILPNGTRLDVGTASGAPNVNMTSNQLLIQQVHKDMDGEYTCVLEDAQRQIFFIPYVIGQIDLPQAILVSLCVTVGFGIACALVLLFDRYCPIVLSSRRHRSRVIDHSPAPVRKQNTIISMDDQSQVEASLSSL